MDFKTGRFVSALTDTVRAWRVVEGADSGGGQWLDAQGRVVNSTSNGLRLRRMAYELSFENWRLDALVTDTVASGTDIVLTPFDARISPRGPGAQSFVMRLIAPSLSEFDLNGGNQKVLANGNVVTFKPGDDALRHTQYSLPPDGPFRTRYREYLQAEPYLEVRVPAMLRQGIAIIRNEREPAEIVRLLTQWVSDSVARTSQPGDPGAIAILKTKSGDASGHAQLFTALARSLDIPTRVVSGAVRIDGRFYFHTWAEVFLRDWVAVDPTFGQFPADAGHIRLAIGGFERQSALKRRMRSLHIEIVEAR
jgi:transglutaminase-like putative cysteine protease